MGFEDGGTEGYFKAVGGALSRLGFMFYMLHDALLSYALYSTLFFFFLCRCPSVLYDSYSFKTSRGI